MLKTKMEEAERERKEIVEMSLFPLVSDQLVFG